MAAEIIPLVELFSAIPDFRQASGKQYALSAILALACAAMLCDIAVTVRWPSGAQLRQSLVAALVLPTARRPASTLH